jgi:predicted nucleic acid-binding protein
MLYIETSVWVAYTVTREKEPEKFNETSILIEQVNAGKVKAVTSMYTLIELFSIVMGNNADKFEGLQEAKDVLLEVLQTKVLITEMLNRQEKLIYGRLFANLADSSDIPHAISAFIYNCDMLVTYDSHFDAITDVIACVQPGTFIK